TDAAIGIPAGTIGTRGVTGTRIAIGIRTATGIGITGTGEPRDPALWVMIEIKQARFAGL
ncbi:MAG: hypothetical protein E6699_26970, partial [Bradyrhizobium sp.]|uniref:hypothetical protein n=1 Tax=Bradyrhizobium sp. TaxID=376 RepID=UPI00290245A0